MPATLSAARATNPRESHFLRVGAHELHYQRLGSGPDVVFVHGWPLHSATFRRITPQLSKEYTCHLFDLPCAGASRSAPAAAVSFRDQIAVLRAAIDGLGLQRYAFVAHDSGGMLARYVAADDPRCAALVLGNTELSQRLPASVLKVCAMAALPYGAKLFRTLLRKRAFRYSSQGFGDTLENRAYLAGEFSQLFLDPLCVTVEAAKRPLAPLGGYPQMVPALREVHARLKAPALLIWGERDSFFPLDGARAMLPEFAAGAELAPIAGGKLYVHEEHPDEFAQLAAAFLARVLLKPSATLSA
jgi:pimeloyl-ACP methyl ester carboxylesterase